MLLSVAPHDINNVGYLNCIKQKYISSKIGKQTIMFSSEQKMELLSSVSSLLSFSRTPLYDPLLVNHQERLRQDISGGPKPPRRCTATSLGTMLSAESLVSLRL